MLPDGSRAIGVEVRGILGQRAALRCAGEATSTRRSGSPLPGNNAPAWAATEATTATNAPAARTSRPAPAPRQSPGASPSADVRTVRRARAIEQFTATASGTPCSRFAAKPCQQPTLQHSPTAFVGTVRNRACHRKAVASTGQCNAHELVTIVPTSNATTLELWSLLNAPCLARLSGPRSSTQRRSEP